MQFLGRTFAGMLWAALAAAPGLAQDAATGGSAGDASRVEGGVADDAATKSGAHINGVDPGGDRGSANRSRAGDASHIGVPARDGSAIEASRAGAPPASAPGVVRPSVDDLGPIRLEGFTGLQRRANRKALIANAPKTLGRPPAAIGVGAPFTFSGGTARGAAGVPGASGSAFGPLSVGRTAPDLKTSATGASTVGSVATTATGAGAAWPRPHLPASAVTVAPPHAAVISGTTVSHIASGPGYLGGPAKDRSAINGTAIRPKH